MSLALIFEDDSVLYLSAVTNYSKSRRSKVAKHPIGARATITDHVTKDNPTFTIQGVISAADFAVNRIPVDDADGNTISTQEQTTPVNDIQINVPTDLTQFLPGSARQFLGTQQAPANITADDFRGYSHQEARDLLYRGWEKAEKITLVDYDYDFSTGRSSSVRVYQECLINDLQDVETVDTGDALEFTMTLEKPRFTFAEEVNIQISSPAPAVSDAAAAEANKGDQTGASDVEGSDAEAGSKRFADFVESEEGLGFGSGFSDLLREAGAPL